MNSLIPRNDHIAQLICKPLVFDRAINLPFAFMAMQFYRLNPVEKYHEDNWKGSVQLRLIRRKVASHLGAIYQNCERNEKNRALNHRNSRPSRWNIFTGSISTCHHPIILN